MTFKDFCDTANKIADQIRYKPFSLLKVSEDWIRCLRYNKNVFPKDRDVKCNILIEHGQNLNELEYELEEIDINTYIKKTESYKIFTVE